ncbi:3-oxoacyl-[acyl-carrier-protein] synthase III C-terminal domain-containing protein [Cupriavidus basilensis]|uniref:3-oxoacyl-[acyl-carrier-protein] synthase III C-terminal domain-containing protein n=1 Tax=Cupriavidus basilensis TaxID=68895 RepID=UPI00075114DD|nr:3-oxoacyl-[acyl-carrier-protein] synthase III C-terminal domain-containing protein [Cupriavidus basilensis]
MLSLTILCTGKALPSQRVSSDELDVKLGALPGFCRSKSGIDFRYVAAPGETQSGLAAAALRDAMRRGRCEAASIDLLLSVSGVGEQALPSTASRILEPAGLPAGTPAFDINASCLGFLAALQLAASLLASGTYRRIAIAASDLASRGVDWDNPEASLIFGDGAAAAIVEQGDARTGIDAFRMETHPAGNTLCEVRAGGTRRNPRTGAEPADYLFRMDGRRLFRLTSELMGGFVERLFSGLPYGPGDVDIVIPHQASHLGMEHVRKRLGIRPEDVVDIYRQHGNQVAASIPTALHEAFAQRRIFRGTRVLLIGTAAGLTLGGMVLVI